MYAKSTVETPCFQKYATSDIDLADQQGTPLDR